MVEFKEIKLAKVHTDDNGTDMMKKSLKKRKLEVCQGIARIAVSST